MPSRKKAKGKARKAAKEAAKAKESKAAARTNQRQNQVESLETETLMPRWVVAQRLSRGLSMTCRHGSDLDDTTPICGEFMSTFTLAFLVAKNRKKCTALDAFTAAHEATAGEEFDSVYSSKLMLEKVVSMLLFYGTDAFLYGDIDNASLYAVAAFHLEEYNFSMSQNEPLFDWVKVAELSQADEHTLAKFYRKRIPCHCLDKKYEEVKSVKQMGICCNLNCSVQRVERRKMFCCTRCGVTNYCSRKCQKADWKSHKEFCNSNIAEKQS